MGDIGTRGQGDDRPSGQPARTSIEPISERVAQARTSLAYASATSLTLIERARTVPPLVRFSVIGLVAMSAVLSSAALLRTRETLDALEGAMTPRPSKTSAAALGSAQSTASASARATTTSAPSTPASATNASSASSAAETAKPNSAAGDQPASAHAPDAELTAARAKGIPALEELSHKYPQDPDLLKALLAAYTRQRNQIAAVNVAERLLDAEPRSADESEVQQAILIIVNGAPAPAAEALRLLATKMGSRGPDLLYELTLAPKIGKIPKDRAADLLRDPSVRQRATPALLIAVDLKNTTPCARKGLLARAQESGDARSLVFLKPMTATTGCGILRRTDCLPCLEPRKDLYDAVTAIQKRIEQGAAPSDTPQ